MSDYDGMPGDPGLFDEPEIRPEVEEWLREKVAPRPGPAARYELLDGEQVALPERTEAHAACVNRLTRLLSESVGDAAIVSVQNPVRLDEDSEPCPDLALLRPRPDGYSTAYASPEEILLVVEIADTQFGLSHARGRKAGSYSRRGVPECWVIDLRSRWVLVHRAPASGGYRDIRNLGSASSIGVASLPGITLRVGDLLGPEGA